MSLDALRSAAREMVDQLIRGDYDLLVQRCARSRLTSEDLLSVIRNYGRKLVSPPSEAYQNLDVIQVNGAAVPTWSVRMPLWTKEEGRSDLTLELTIMVASNKASVELDDLHVL